MEKIMGEIMQEHVDRLLYSKEPLLLFRIRDLKLADNATDRRI